MSQPSKTKLLELRTDTVRPEWIDYNGHMNVAYYVLAFDYATDAFLDYIGLTREFKESVNSTTFALDMNVSYKREVLEGDPLRFTTQLVDADEKRLHFFHQMFHATEGYLAATNEVLSVHVDLDSRRIAPMPDALRQRVDALWRLHRDLPRPEPVGRTMGIRRKAS
ncbi:MAG: thioesterase family protein [Alphaproteobacteria bacterium]|nr:thioesterase family protein [Alphaproteobacteria bacterium]